MNMMDKGSDNWALITPVDLEVEREKHGYKILKDDTIKCADCGKKLVDIIKVKEDESQRKAIDAECPCGGSSFLYIITGHTYMQASEGRAIGDMPTEVKHGVMHMTVKVIQ